MVHRIYIENGLRHIAFTESMYDTPNNKALCGLSVETLEEAGAGNDALESGTYCTACHVGYSNAVRIKNYKVDFIYFKKE